MNRKIIILTAIIIIAAAFCAAFLLERPSSEGLQLIAKAAYSCDGGKTIQSSFYTNPKAPAPVEGEKPQPAGSALVTLNDGRTMNLAQTISADGARYATGDESFVFWTKGYGAFVSENGTTTYSNCVQQFPEESFANAAGGYSFEYPNIWNAEVNKYNSSNSLFGPDASSTAGLGGVEVFPNEKSIDAFLNGVSANYSNKTQIMVDGVQGVSVSYEASVGAGQQVVLFKNGTIYNIYISSTMGDDVGFFNQLVNSFKFAR